MQAQSSPFIRSIWHMAWVCGVKTVGPVRARNMTLHYNKQEKEKLEERQFRRIARVVAAVAIKPSCDTPEFGWEGTEPPEITFLWKTYALFAFTSPPVGENGNAFGSALSNPSSTCDSNLGSIGRSVHDLCRSSWNRPLPLTSGADCGRALRDLRNPPVPFCSSGSRDTVYKFSWDLAKICRNRSEKCVLKKIQNGGKSI